MTTYTMEQLMLVSNEVLKILAQQFNTPHKDADDVEILVNDILEAQKQMATLDTEEIVPVKKKRGRPSKAEIAAREAAEAVAKAIKCEEEKKNSDDVQGTIFVGNTNLVEGEDSITKEISTESNEDETVDTLEKEFVTICNEDSIQIDENFVIVENLPEFEAVEEEFYSEIEDFDQTEEIAETVIPESQTEEVTLSSTPPSLTEPSIPDTIYLDGGGVLELTKEGYGFLRSADYNYLTSPDDIYVSPMQLRQYGLKPGDVITGKIKVPREDDKFFVLNSVETINGKRPLEVRNRIAFEHLVPLFPDEKFSLCTGTKDSLSRRVVDIFAPIGKGQRALIVAQPKTGKTMLMKEIANAIAENHPETYLIMLLIDERPEEVTDIKRTVKAEVIASTFDAPASNHVKIAGIVLEKAKRMVECGHDVVIFLDSITRLARAYNTEAPASGKILSGGVDANSLQRPKRFFGAARNIENGGSLTIIATALIDTGSRMDEVIFEEFKGTGNMELQLDRQLANKRIFPAVNVMASSTRRDDLLLSPTTCNRMWVFRNYLSQLNTVEAMQEVIKQMDNTLNNEEMLLTMNKD